MLYWLTLIRKLRKFKNQNRELLWPLALFFFAFIIFNLVMIGVEGLAPLAAFYFSFVTATTVGYGDISPATPWGRAASIIYMLVSIGTLAAALGFIASKATNLLARKQKGLIMVKENVDLLIIGYPNEAKVKEILYEFRKDRRFINASMVVVTDRLAEKPEWMDMEDVHFVKGLASKRETLEQANVHSAERVLVLADDPYDEASDEYSSSAVIMSERLNPKAYTVAEKVRQDGYLFQVAECDLVVSVSRAGELVQELQDPGAIALAETLFSNTEKVNQYNMVLPQDAKWQEVVLDILSKGGNALGYKKPEADAFCFNPKREDSLPAQSIIKYISDHPLTN